MWDFDDTEAAHLSEIYCGAEIYEPLSTQDKADYIRARGRCFRKKDIGKYVVVQDSRMNKKVMPIMYLVNRQLTKRMWWSPASIYAMVFDKKSAAEYQADKYKYNKARVMQIKPHMADLENFIEKYDKEGVSE